MIGPRHEIAWLQSGFYRDQYHKMLRWLMYAMLVILVLIGGIIYLILIQPPQSYYANTLEGQILPMPAARRI